MTTANIDHLANWVMERDNLTAEIKRLTEARNLLDKHIQQEMGAAEVATIGGRPAFTYKHTGTFESKRFATEQPALLERYTVLVPELDKDKLAAECPEVYAAYRGRRFERKG